MKKILFILVVAYGVYHWYINDKDHLSGTYGKTHNELIMYSLTTCGFCKQKARELRAENISFREYYIDKDKNRMEELNTKLSKAGFKPKRYGTPIFDVHGVMLPNNPAMSVIKSYLSSN